MAYLLVIAIGIFLSAFMPVFIAPSLILAAIIFLVIAFVLTGRSCYLLVAFLAGLLWGYGYASQRVSTQLPDSLDKKQLIIRGAIVGLVERSDQRLRFKLDVDSLALRNPEDGFESDISPLLNTVLLSWYGDQKTWPTLKTGEYWQFNVRLRKPRGLLNLGGFDYQAWLFVDAISATGYIVESALNRPLADGNCSLVCSILRYANTLRAEIGQVISSSTLSVKDQAFIKALTIGDKQDLSQWRDDLARYGIIHLMVISGLHVGLVAGLGYGLGSFFSRIALFALSYSPFRVVATKFFVLLPSLVSLSIAIAYSLLAGFTLPTQRALIVVVMIILCKILYLPITAYGVFVWSLFLIALFQPLAVLSASFWLSFCAVLILILFFSPRIFSGAKFRQIFAAQGILFVAMAAPMLFFIGQTSWLGVLVNIVAVPVVSMVTVPLCLIAALTYFIWPSMADTLWHWAGLSLTALWRLLDVLPPGWGLFSLPFPITVTVIGSMVISACCWFIPRGIQSRWLLLLPFLLLLLFHKPRPPLRVTVLDVGQGLAVVVEAEDRLLVYDTGPRFSSQFNAGSGVVAPFIRRRGYSAVETLVISHGDMDHAGGFIGLHDSLKIKQSLLAPGYFEKMAGIKSFTLDNSSQCVSGKSWSWPAQGGSYFVQERIYFDVLMPIKSHPGQIIPDENNFSCVLAIRWRNKTILLAGDIEKSAESIFLQHYNVSPVTVLVAPHHGSKTSSSKHFIDMLQPKHVVFSAGYRHHFGHPHHDVVDRYKASGSTLWNTASNGGISFEWNINGDLSILTARKPKADFWWR
jgi:competence protein ComEC